MSYYRFIALLIPSLWVSIEWFIDWNYLLPRVQLLLLFFSSGQWSIDFIKWWTFISSRRQSSPNYMVPFIKPPSSFIHSLSIYIILSIKSKSSYLAKRRKRVYHPRAWGWRFRLGMVSFFHKPRSVSRCCTLGRVLQKKHKHCQGPRAHYGKLMSVINLIIIRL